MLRTHSKNKLLGFSWDALKTKVLVNAPNLLSVLEACTHTKSPRPNCTAVIGMCVALILRHRFTKMCLLQKMISLILYAGHSDKQVHKVLVAVAYLKHGTDVHRFMSACRS